jgi:hypothetical protein
LAAADGWRALAYTQSTEHSPVHFRSVAMGKVQKNNKETKKQSLLTPKEKKAAKQAKKHGSVSPPIVAR